jgi:hypothetical protein
VAGAGTPTWQLVLAAAEDLAFAQGEFRLQELVGAVRRVDPARQRSSIQPVVQGMTINAGNGPPSPCGKPLVRVSHGIYRLASEVPPVNAGSVTGDRPSPAHRAWPVKRTRRDQEVARRIAEVIAWFPDYVSAYDHLVPFTRSGQYEWHRAAIQSRLRWLDVGDALADDALLGQLYQTLQKWGIGRRQSRLVPLAEFRRALRSRSTQIAELGALSIDDPGLDVAGTAGLLWNLIEQLGVVTNVALIVAGSKTLHHLLPDLVPPMDRAWTGAFFLWSTAGPQSAQRATFVRTFAGFADIAVATEPSRFVGQGWRTSRTKILDNAIIGYCKTHAIAPANAPQIRG